MADRIDKSVLGIVALVDDTPEEPEGGDPGPDEGGAGGPDGPDAPLRGWIDPDRRLWRHPSEVSGTGAPGAGGPGAGVPAAPAVFGPPPRHPYRTAAMVLVGVLALMAAIAWFAVLSSPTSQRPPHGATATGDTAEDAPLTTLAGSENTVPASAEAAGRSMVQLQVTTPHGPVALVGIAVAEGGLVVTMADPLSITHHVVMIGPGGKHEPVSVVATDHATDVALLQVPRDVPVPTFADDATLANGAPELTLSFVPAGGTSFALHGTPGLVTSVGATIPSGPAGGMPAITTSAATPTAAGGEPLLDGSGAILGFLYDPAPGSASPPTFLPSKLVVGVANDLRSHDRVVHGWLGIKGADAPGGGGAQVEAVASKSPASGSIQVGEVITAVNSVPVHTMAELRARLYLLSPGTRVALGVERATGSTVVDVTLSGSS